MATMNGQWLGDVRGDGTGQIIVNVDKRGDHYEGIAYLHDDDPEMPMVLVPFHTKDLNERFEIRSPVQSVHPTSGQVVDWNQLKSSYPSVGEFSSYADIIGSVSDESLILDWITDIGIKGHAELPRSEADKASEIDAESRTWETFKAYVAEIGEHRRFLFRGQREPWRLRTSFHRAGRANLPRYVVEDIQDLRKHLSARTTHVFNLGDPDENGAFHNLVQHHGYPTPLLDWSYSPYVAAFFAYREVSNREADSAPDDSKVRIHILDRTKWIADVPETLHLNSVRLFVSIGEFLAIENERMIPQQGASTVTNVDDIESFVRVAEQTNGASYLKAVDLPKRERRRVMQELSYMGITAGSLFPGLDGACQELKERNFDL